MNMSKKIFVLTAVCALLLITALLSVGAPSALAATQQAGDQICTGDNLIISGGQSSGNILAFGCNVDVQRGATVYGSIADFGGNVQIAGAVNGSIATFGGNVTLAETAVVQGNVAALGGNYISAPGATVRGNATSSVSPIAPTQSVPFNPIARMFNFRFDLLGGIITALAFAALGALIVIFAPNATRRVSEAAQRQPLNVAGVGCLTLIVFPILMILLLITIIGIPIALLLGLATWAAWIFGGIAIGLLAGEKILGAFKMTNILPVLAVMLGMILLMLIGQIPILGWLVSCLVGLLGLGAVVMTRFGTRAYPAAPGMTLVPVVPAPSAPGTFMPTAVDVAAWEAKARQAQAREAAVASDIAPSAIDMPSSPPPALDAPDASDEK